MEANAQAILTETETVEMARGGSSETVEVRGRVTSSKILADLIAAFAHHEGGSIIFGYRASKGVVGCNRTRVEHRYEEALLELGDEHTTSICFHTINRRVIAVVQVPKHVIPSRPLIRVRTTVRIMSRQQLIKIVGRTKGDTPLAMIGSSLVLLAEKLRQAERDRDNANSWRRKVRDGIIGYAIGASFTALGAYLSGIIQLR